MPEDDQDVEDSVAAGVAEYQLLIPQPEWFYAYSDEENFFRWLESIDAVKEVVGGKDGLLLTIKAPTLEDFSLRDMLALFQRYGLNMSCLKGQVTSDNQHWFKDPKMYWYKSIFE